MSRIQLEFPSLSFLPSSSTSLSLLWSQLLSSSSLFSPPPLPLNLTSPRPNSRDEGSSLSVRIRLVLSVFTSLLTLGLQAIIVSSISSGLQRTNVEAQKFSICNSSDQEIHWLNRPQLPLKESKSMEMRGNSQLDCD